MDPGTQSCQWQKSGLCQRKHLRLDARAFRTKQKWEKTAVIWIGACGIAVRAMAPSLRDKLTDIPVLVVDEAGQFVIPVCPDIMAEQMNLQDCLQNGSVQCLS